MHDFVKSELEVESETAEAQQQIVVAFLWTRRSPINYEIKYRYGYCVVVANEISRWPFPLTVVRNDYDINQYDVVPRT